MFQSKLFRRLFSTYILVIFVCLFVYTSFIVYENHQINRIQIARKSEIQLDEVGSILDQRLSNARNIVQNLSYSTSLKQLYLSSQLGTMLNSYTLFTIQSELKNTMASGGLSIYKTIIFLDNNKAYSSIGVISLSEEYQAQNQEFPCLISGSLNQAFGMNSKRYSFNKESLLYCDVYTYQTGRDIGTICILFDIKTLQNDIQDVLQEGYGARILYNDNEILQFGDAKGNLYSKESGQISGITYEVYASSKIPMEGDRVFYLIMGIIVVISIFFVWLAYWASKKYYLPINRLGQMVTGEEESEENLTQGKKGEVLSGEVSNEMDNIISGIRNLIGEKNGYREKMLTITPYAKTGMLHFMLSGNMESDTIQIFSEENYLDLIKPYFIVSIVNFAYDRNTAISEDSHKQELNELFQTITEVFSTDELHMAFYFRDIYNVFLIMNFDSEQLMDETFYQIHKYIRTSGEKNNCHVTMGVDIVRDDINELKSACEGALKALDGILTDGRGEVYFLEAASGKPSDYFFPVNFQEKLRKYLEKYNKDKIREFLSDIYQKNWDLGGSPEMYRALIDELHLSIIKTLKEITKVNTVHINIEKYRSLATLKEVFDYYDAALLSIADSLYEQAIAGENDLRLEDDIITFIEDNTYDPDLSLQSLTDKFKVSNKYLSLLCKKRYGVTYLQYIQDKRINRAVELLKGGQYSLTEVGNMCGYTNQLTFRRNFKSIMGMNPSDFLEEN